MSLPHTDPHTSTQLSRMSLLIKKEVLTENFSLRTFDEFVEFMKSKIPTNFRLINRTTRNFTKPLKFGILHVTC